MVTPFGFLIGAGISVFIFAGSYKSGKGAIAATRLLRRLWAVGSGSSPPSAEGETVVIEGAVSVDAAPYGSEDVVEEPDSPAVEVVPYFDLEEIDRPAVPMALAMGDGEDADLTDAKEEHDHRRIDVAALDENGDVVVTVEAEQVNHDLRRGAPANFDKMAACDPEEAIWVAMSHSEAHEILEALNDPLEGEPRVEKTYADSTPAQLWKLDTPCCTDFYTLEQV